MERLSGLDASFLYLETPQQLMHVCGLIVLDPATMPGGYSFAALRAEVDRRVRDVPMFNRMLHMVPFGMDHPLWEKDPHFDIERHVHRLACPAPGGDRELAELCGHIAGIPLDRARPLWEMWVIEGLADGRIAVFSKMHHATVDGVSGANMIGHLCSLAPDDPPLELGGKDQPEGPTRSDAALFALGVVANVTRRPFQVVKVVGPTVGTLTKTIGRARSGTAMAAPLTAPRTSFNGTIDGRRNLAFTNVSLDRIREIKNAVDGATVNDVVLAVSGGALRRYLEKRGELPRHSLLASVPVSVRGESRRKRGSNKVSSLFSRLGTDEADPLARLRAMSVANAHAKEHHKAIPADTLQEWAEFAAPRTFGMAVRMYSALKLAERHPVVHNLVISNVPGPPIPLYFMGARIEALYPLGPVFHGAGLNITVMSNNGMMNIGAIASTAAMPDTWALIEEFPAELDALHEAVLGRSGAKPRKTSAKRTAAKKPAAGDQ